ncbi:hypothetical protein LTR72_007876 [Exophiala xenobiotica]|nr:hypothetical protein LTR41_010866 [Exophiala xenobiotica]KAK5219492.1 hypothetical protein LTR72_007876 [Exophiala xenobiotica]KAK5477768.1 hypothetical protein LTR55_008360 [Exophiala xenobiotica]
MTTPQSRTQGRPQPVEVRVATETSTTGIAGAGDGADAAPGVAPKKKYVRVITDKRREQNRRAQKAYKDRLRRKLEELEGWAEAQSSSTATATATAAGAQQDENENENEASTNVTVQQPASVSGSGNGSGRRRQVQQSVPRGRGRHDPSSVASQHTSSTTRTQATSPSPGNSNSYPDLIEPVYSSTSIHSQSEPDPHIIDLGDAFAAAGDLPFAAGSLPGLAFLGQDMSTPSPTPKSSTIPDAETEIHLDGNAGLVHHHVHEDYGELDMRHIWAMPPRPPWQNYTPPTRKKNKKRSSTALMFTPQSQSSHHSFPGGFGVGIGIDGGRNTNTSFGISTQVPRIPDPYANHMRLWTEDNVEAAIAIAMAIGISRSDYLNDHPSRFPGCYVALNRPSDMAVARPIKYMFDGSDGQGWRNGMEVTKELSEHMDLVKPALRPTPGQLLEPHPSYLDCVVFPWFREHAVRASVAGKLDHMELFMDIMNGGLVCWGAGSGMGTGRIGKKGVGKRGMRESVAWNTRSWEARRWFLKKWEWLVGTEEDEERRGDVFGIWRGSRWWWRMRGDDDEDDDSDDGDDGEGDVYAEAEMDEVQEGRIEEGTGTGMWETTGMEIDLLRHHKMADMEVDASDTDSRISIPDQLAYWAQISADDNGMLGGYPQISRIDIQFSRTFLRKLQRTYPGSVPGLGSDGNDDDNDNMSGRTRGRGRGATGATTTKETTTTTTTTTTTNKYAFRHCLETGAGIGRVTFNLLAGMCERIDIIEPIEKFTDVLTDRDSPIVKAGQLRRVWNVPLQEWTVGMEPSWECGDGDGDGDGDEPEQKRRQRQQQQHMDSNTDANADATYETRAATGEKENGKEGGGGEEGRYDLIYNQWCLNHLTFESLVRYFASLIPLLAKGGWIIVKENLSTEVSGGDTFWEEDSSVARSDGNWRASFDKAGLKVMATQLQTGFPRQLGLLPVRMYALRPVENLRKTG